MNPSHFKIFVTGSNDLLLILMHKQEMVSLKA